MNTKAIFFAAIAACVSSGAAVAQSHDYRGDRGDRSERYQQRQYEAQYNRGDNDHRGNRAQRDYSHDRYDGRRDGYRGERQVEYRNEHRGYRQNDGYNGYQRQHVGSNYQMRRGGYVPVEYRSDRYVVRDWRRHQGMYAPQRGYQWVQSGNDFVLVALATGLIAHVLMN